MRRYGLTLRYAVLQAAYWMSTCLIYANTDVFLQAYGLSATQIGLELALSCAAAALIQPLVAAGLDRSRRVTLKAAIAGFAAVAMALAVITRLTDKALAVTLLFGFMSTVTIGVQPLINSVGFALIDSKQWVNYSAARGIASGCYALIVLLYAFVAKFDVRYMLWLYLGMNALMLVSLLLFRLPKADASAPRPKPTPTPLLLKRYWFFALMLVGLTLVFVGHQIINNFLIFIVEERGGGVAERGTAVSLSALVEIPMMILFVFIARKIRIETLIRFAGVCFTVKIALLLPNWGMTGVYISSLVQMLGYAIMIPASSYYVNALMEDADQIKGQALLTGAITASGVIASLVGGVLIDSLGAQGTLFVGTLLSGVGSVLFLLFTKRVPERKGVLRAE